MMTLFIWMLLVSTISATLFADPQLDSKWEFHKESNRKVYTAEEDAMHKQYFALTDRHIERQNRFRRRAYTAAHNDFSDMSPDEKKAHLGLSAMKKTNFLGRKWSPGIQNRTFEIQYTILDGPDYRTNRCLQPIRNQGSCGSCWAFTAITPLEFSQCSLTGTPVTLSEQHLVDCDSANYGCSGGWYDTAWEFLKDGSMLDEEYGRYTATEKTCNAENSVIGGKVLSYEWIDPSTEAMMEALQDGPIAVALTVVNSFYSYGSGIYYAFNCRAAVNHAVVIVGYGSKLGVPYWIVRNSWGETWGDGGYMLIRLGVNMCNIEQYPARVTAKAL